MKYKKSSAGSQENHDSVNAQQKHRGIFGRMLGSRAGVSAESALIGGVDSRAVEEAMIENEASLTGISDDLQVIAKLAQGFEAEQRTLTESLASQLHELKSVQISTHDYAKHLKDLLDGPIQMLEERVSNRVDLKTWYDEVSRIKTQLHTILSSVNDQHGQGAQLQRVCEAQDKRVQQLENQCSVLEQAFSQQQIGSDYNEQRLSKTVEQLREQQGQFESSLRQLHERREVEQGQLITIQQQLQRLQLETERVQTTLDKPDLEDWQSLLNDCKTQILQVQNAQATVQKNATQIETIANTALKQFSETQKTITKMHAYREAMKLNLQQLDQEYVQHSKKMETKLTVVDERIGHLDTLVQDTQQALILANNARKVAVKFNQEVDIKLQDIRQVDQSIKNSLQSSQQWANQFDTFEQRVTELVSQLDEGKQEEHALLKELSVYRSTFDQHAQDWSQFKNWCQQLSENLVAAEIQLTQEKLQVSAYLAETEKLVKVVHEDAQQFNGQQNVVEQALHQLKSLYQQVNGLLEQHQQGRLSVENLLASEKALNHELSAQSQQVNATLQEMTIRLQDFDALSAQVKQDHGCVRALISSCKRLMMTAKNQETQNGENIQKISEALHTFKQMQNSFTTITQQYGQMNQQAKVLNQELVEGTQQLQALENKVDTSCNVLISLTEREQQRAHQMQDSLVHMQLLQKKVESDHVDTHEKLQTAQQLESQAKLCLQKAEKLREEMHQVLQKTAETAINVREQAGESQRVLQNSEASVKQQQDIEQNFKLQLQQIKIDFQNQFQQLNNLQNECQQTINQAKKINDRTDMQQDDLDSDRQKLQNCLGDSEALLLKNREILDQMSRLQQQVFEATDQVARAEKQASQLIGGVFSANQSAQECISDIHQVKQQVLNLFQQGEQLLFQSQQHQKDFELSLVTHENWHRQYAELAESAQQSAKQVLEYDASLHDSLLQQQQLKEFLEEKCGLLEKNVDENLRLTQEFHQRTTTELTDVHSTIAQYRDVHLHSQNALIKSEELHTKIFQLLEASKDHANQVDSMRRQIHSEVNNLKILSQQHHDLQNQITPHVKRLQVLEQHLSHLGEQWSIKVRQAEQEQEQQQALNLRCEQLQSTTETLQSSLDAELKSSHAMLQENRKFLQESQTQLKQSIQSQKILQQDLLRYSNLSEQLGDEQKRYLNMHQSLQESHQQVNQHLQISINSQSEQNKVFSDLSQQLGVVQKNTQDNDQRLDRLETAMDHVMRSFKEFVATHHESKNLNKETYLAAKEQKLLLKEMENEIKELKFALKVREKSSSGYVGRQYSDLPSTYPLEEERLSMQKFSFSEASPKNSASQFHEPTSVVTAPLVDRQIFDRSVDVRSEQKKVSGREWLDDLAQIDDMEAPDTEVSSDDRRGRKGFLFSLVLMTGLLWPVNTIQAPKHLQSSVVTQTELTYPASKPTVKDTSASKHLTLKETTTFLHERTWPLESTRGVKYSDFRSGVYLQADLHAPIRALQPGVVVYTGADLTGLGQVVILQHRHELMTIYGNNVENLVSKGDMVANGQVIARIGQIGAAAPAVYFEVRFQGQPEDPFVYWRSTIELT